MKKFLALAMILCVLAQCFLLASCIPDDTSDTASGTTSESEKRPDGNYTYNSALSTFPTNWNPHVYQTNTDSTILDYTSQGFYQFDYNSTLDGYKIVPAMATGDPVDVTAEYVGRFGITEGESSKAYKITLRQDIKWEDGTAIKASDFVTSAQLLLDPAAQNYRADSLYSGSLVIVNAREYLYQGQDIKNANSTDGETYKYALDALVKGDDGYYTTPDGAAAYFGLKTGYAWMGGNALTDYSSYIPEHVLSGLNALADDEGFVRINDAAIDLLFEFTGSETWGSESRNDLAYYISYDETYPELSWDEVGLFSTGEYELVLVLTKPLKGFYLYYSLTDSWLVNETLYKACSTVSDGIYTSTYGTSKDTTISYGPYKLIEFQSDKIIVLDRNENWYGYNDAENANRYWTSKVQFDYVPEASTRLELFLNGKLDTYGLSADDMETYARSEHTYYTTGDSTFFMAFNPNVEALRAASTSAANKAIIAVKEFRMAMSFALDRAAFCLATSPTNNAAFAIFSSFIISDPDQGTAYRTTEQAKQVIANFWGLSEDIGEGKLYPTIDDAIESVTGYNLTKARQLFDEAYDNAIALGYIAEGDIIEIKIGTPNATSNFYNKGYDFIVNNYTEAVKDTKLEGILTFTRDSSLGNEFSAALKNNQVDMLFGVGWTGSALDPYNLMEAYTGTSYQYDPAWDTTATPLKITIDGVEYTATVWEWTTCIMGEEIEATAADGTKKTFSEGSAEGDPAARLNILAALENAVLDTYDMIPIMDDSSANLKGMQFNYYTEEYIYGVGRGGIKYYTYNYSDEEWDAYVTSQGGTLNYK